jgi:hypothetical protein
MKLRQCVLLLLLPLQACRGLGMARVVVVRL